MPGLNTLLTLGAKAGERVGTALKDIGKGIRAYHSSPHDFDRFDMSKIGTGEGAQVYGRGLYFAENPAVSGQGGEYWHQFKPRFSGPEADAAGYLARAQFDREQALKRVLEDQSRIRASKATTYSPDLPESNWWHPSNVDKLQETADLLASGKPVGPRTYEVNINAQPEQLLNWDKPLTAQSPHVQSVLPNLNIDSFVRTYPGENNPPTGKSLYNYLRALKGDAAPKVLDAQGIPGIQYLDQGSRAAGQGTSNYVTFRDDLVDILKKYGIGAAVPAGGALMQPSDERQ